jgi:hypothetical protein
LFVPDEDRAPAGGGKYAANLNRQNIVLHIKTLCFGGKITSQLRFP